MSLTHPHPLMVWTEQTPAEQTKTPPVTDTWYELLSVTGGVMLKQLSIYQKNDETDPKNIDVKITIDGIEFAPAGSVPLTDDKAVFFYMIGTPADAGSLDLLMFAIDKSIPFLAYSVGAGTDSGGNQEPIMSVGEYLKCKTLLIEYRNHSAAGTNQTMTACANYAIMEAI